VRSLSTCEAASDIEGLLLGAVELVGSLLFGAPLVALAVELEAPPVDWADCNKAWRSLESLEKASPTPPASGAAAGGGSDGGPAGAVEPSAELVEDEAGGDGESSCCKACQEEKADELPPRADIDMGGLLSWRGVANTSPEFIARFGPRRFVLC
jgi:hypothetical protein